MSSFTVPNWAEEPTASKYIIIEETGYKPIGRKAWIYELAIPTNAEQARGLQHDAPEYRQVAEGYVPAMRRLCTKLNTGQAPK